MKVGQGVHVDESLLAEPAPMRDQAFRRQDDKTVFVSLIRV